MKRRHLLGCMLVACLSLITTTGCGGSGPKLAKVTGKVTLKGQPIKGANVQFQPENGPMAIGITDDQGSFTLTTNGRAGAPVGLCKVSVSKPAAAPTSSMPANPTPEDMAKMASAAAKGGGLKRTEPPKSEVPEKYGDPSQSGLTADVSSNAADNNFEFTLQ